MIVSRTAALVHFLSHRQPTEKDVLRVLDALQELLWREMLRLGVWRRKPAVWGYAGGSWQEEEPFYALLRDYFAELFLGPRLSLLQQRAQHAQSLRLLLRLLLGEFLSQREQQHDPQGYALSRNLQSAALTLISAGRFRLLPGPESTLTSMSLVAAPANCQEPVWNFQDLQHAVSRYSKEKSELLTWSLAGVEKGRQLLLWLAQHSPGIWLLGNLIEAVRLTFPGMTPTQVPIKFSSRFKRTRTHTGADKRPASVFAQLAQHYDPDTLLRRLDERIAQAGWQERVKARLQRLWHRIIRIFRQKGSFPSQSFMQRRLGGDPRLVQDALRRLRWLAREELRTLQS
jgi:hypothetical protein